MRDFSRRGLLGMGLGAAAAVGIAGCTSKDRSENGRRPDQNPADKGGNPSVEADPIKRIGDGSTADTGPQPHQPVKPVRLEPGQTPPQFVVFSWDGAGEIGNGLFPRFLKLAKDHGAAMTFFLSGSVQSTADLGC